MARLIDHAPDEVHGPDAPSVAARPWPLVAAGVVGALAAGALSLIVIAIPVFSVWLTAPEVGPGWSTWQEVVRIVGIAWLAGHGLPVEVGGLVITLLPWGLLALSMGLLYLAGRWAARMSAVGRPVEALAVTLSGATAYAGLATGCVAWVGDGASGPGRVLVTTFVCAAVALGWGSIAGAGLSRSVRASWPQPIRRIAAAATVALATLVVGAGVGVGVALVAQAGSTQQLLSALAPDIAGFIAVAVLSIGYLPIVVVWAMSYLLGTGFTVSAGVVISPFADPQPAVLPVFPLLGVLPQEPPMGAQLLPAIGLLAGMLAASVLKRRGARGLTLAGEAAATVVLATAMFAVLAVAASGSLGGGQLAHLGPTVLPTLGVAAVLWAVGSLIIVIPALASAMPDSLDEADEEFRHGEHHP